MEENRFAEIAGEEWNMLPEKYVSLIKNVALLIEDEPDEEVKRDEGLEEGDTLLGIYKGIPNTERGSDYGVGGTLPDTISLYRLPLLEEAAFLQAERNLPTFEDGVRAAIRETIWHEIGHYVGLDEHSVNAREDEGTNRFTSQ